MKTGILSLLLLAILVAAYVGSGNYGRPSAAAKAAPAARRQIHVLGETAAYRRIAHALGESRVPRHPQRIVSLSAAATDSLVALGVQPCLVESAWKSGEAAPYLAAGLQGTTAVRRVGGLAIETVLDANPDLILINNLQDGRYYEQLQQIAPTVVLGSLLPGDPEAMLLDVGDVLGLAKLARVRAAAYRRRLAQAKAALAGNAHEPVVFLRFRQHTCVVYAQATMFGPLLFKQLGLTPDASMPLVMSPGGWDVLTMERLSLVRPQHIFAVIDNDSEAYHAYVTATPIWRRIPAVRNGHVHVVAASTWLGGEGVLASEAIVDDVLQALVSRKKGTGSVAQPGFEAGAALPPRCLSPFSAGATQCPVATRGQAPSPQVVFCGLSVSEATEPVPFCNCRQRAHDGQSPFPRESRHAFGPLLLTAAAVALLVVGVAASLHVGEVSIKGATVYNAVVHYDGSLTEHVIVRDWRLPRAVADILVGAALAVAGAIMQSVTRNPLGQSRHHGPEYGGQSSPRCWRWSCCRRLARRIDRSWRSPGPRWAPRWSTA